MHKLVYKIYSTTQSVGGVVFWGGGRQKRRLDPANWGRR